MHSIYAANSTDNAYTIHQAPLFSFFLFFLFFACSITRKKKKEEKSLMSDNKEALWTCLIIIKYHN